MKLSQNFIGFHVVTNIAQKYVITFLLWVVFFMVTKIAPGQCLKKHVEVRIDSGWVKSIPCPNPNCMEPMVENDIEQVAGQVAYERFLQFKMLAELRAEPTCRWCPKPDCASPVIGDPRDPNFPCLRCQKCDTQFCYECDQLVRMLFINLS
jgi:hypothetical protein